MVAALEHADHVVISEEYGKMDHARLVEILLHNVYVVPSTDSMFNEKSRLIEENGGIIVASRRLPPEHRKGEASTTSLEKRLTENIRECISCE